MCCLASSRRLGLTVVSGETVSLLLGLPALQQCFYELASLMEPYLLIPLPEMYDDDRVRFHSFLVQCCMLFVAQHELYSQDSAMVRLVASFLTGDVLNFATLLVEHGSPVLQGWGAFLKECVTMFWRVSPCPNSGDCAAVPASKEKFFPGLCFLILLLCSRHPVECGSPTLISTGVCGRKLRLN